MIIIVRHGETIWNLEKRKQGRKDSPLTLRGINQGVQVSKLLNSFFIEREVDTVNLFSSSLGRALQYRSILLENLQIKFHLNIISDDLVEHSFGLWEGLNEAEIEIDFPGQIKKREKNWWNYTCPEGESYSLIYKRVSKYIKFLDLNPENVNIFIVHEMISKVMRGYFMELSKEKILKLHHNQNTIYIIEDQQIKELTFFEN
jgi:broad specificity phosphatase PhoE